MNRRRGLPARVARVARSAIAGRFAIAVLAAAALAALSPGLGPAALDAQRTGPPETPLRALETVDPATGQSSLELMSPQTPEEIAAVERRLAAEGHRPGAVDGRLDEQARRALRAFQRSEGLTVCGCVDAGTVRALGLELRVLMTRLADGGARRGAAAGADGDVSAGVEVLYPTTTSPAARPTAGEPGAGAVSGAGAGTDASAAGRGSAGVEDVTGLEGRERFGVHSGHVVPVGFPIFLGPGAPTPPGTGVRKLPAGRRGVFRLAPFPRVPMPPVRPPKR